MWKREALIPAAGSSSLLTGDPLRPENLLVLWAIAMTGCTVAYLVISQRDISR